MSSSPGGRLIDIIISQSISVDLLLNLRRWCDLPIVMFEGCSFYIAEARKALSGDVGSPSKPSLTIYDSAWYGCGLLFAGKALMALTCIVASHNVTLYCQDTRYHMSSVKDLFTRNRGSFIQRMRLPAWQTPSAHLPRILRLLGRKTYWVMVVVMVST